MRVHRQEGKKLGASILELVSSSIRALFKNYFFCSCPPICGHTVYPRERANGHLGKEKHHRLKVRLQTSPSRTKKKAQGFQLKFVLRIGQPSRSQTKKETLLCKVALYISNNLPLLFNFYSPCHSFSPHIYVAHLHLIPHLTLFIN